MRLLHIHCSLYICNIGYCSRNLTVSPNLIFNEYTCILKKWVNRPVNLFWSELSHFFGVNSPVRNFERNVPEESSREELVLERTVPEPSHLPATMAYLQAPLCISCTAILRAAILELQAVSVVIQGPVKSRELINSPAM